MPLHIKNGLYIESDPDGTVHITVKADDAENAELYRAYSLSPEEWASVVVSVSAHKTDPAGAFYQASVFHKGGSIAVVPPPPDAPAPVAPEPAAPAEPTPAPEAPSEG